jgi:hypothetical protein
MASHDEYGGWFPTRDGRAPQAGPVRQADPGTRRWGDDPDEVGAAARSNEAQAERDRQGGCLSPDDGRVRGGRDQLPIDAEHDPGRAGHLAFGSGGCGDWAASAYGSGLRRGPGGGDEPFRPDPAFASDRWRGDQPPQARFGTADDRGAGRTDPSAGAAYGPQPGRGPKGWQRSDTRLHDDVCERLARSEHLDVADVSVEVRDGHVTLQGTVADRRMKHAIEDRVDSVVGVRDIDNRIKVMRVEPGMPGALAADAPPSPHASVPQDSPTARDEARGIFSEPMAGGSGKSG